MKVKRSTTTTMTMMMMKIKEKKIDIRTVYYRRRVTNLDGTDCAIEPFKMLKIFIFNFDYRTTCRSLLYFVTCLCFANVN